MKWTNQKEKFIKKAVPEIRRALGNRFRFNNQHIIEICRENQRNRREAYLRKGDEQRMDKYKKRIHRNTRQGDVISHFTTYRCSHYLQKSHFTNCRCC